jgi:hypothetical protein
MQPGGAGDAATRARNRQTLTRWSLAIAASVAVVAGLVLVAVGRRKA